MINIEKIKENLENNHLDTSLIDIESVSNGDKTRFDIILNSYDIDIRFVTSAILQLKQSKSLPNIDKFNNKIIMDNDCSFVIKYDELLYANTCKKYESVCNIILNNLEDSMSNISYMQFKNGDEAYSIGSTPSTNVYIGYDPRNYGYRLIFGKFDVPFSKEEFTETLMKYNLLFDVLQTTHYLEATGFKYSHNEVENKHNSDFAR